MPWSYQRAESCLECKLVLFVVLHKAEVHFICTVTLEIIFGLQKTNFDFYLMRGFRRDMLDWFMQTGSVQ